MGFQSGQPGKPVVLLVEDDEVLRYVYAGGFAEAGMEVMEASNGKEALHSMEARIPDIVITDIHMPGMGGFELIRRMRENPKSRSVQVIAISSIADKETRGTVSELEVSGFFQKPIEKQEMIAIVRRQLTEHA